MVLLDLSDKHARGFNETVCNESNVCSFVALFFCTVLNPNNVDRLCVPSTKGVTVRAMSSDRFLSLPVILTLALVLALATARATASTVWVAPTEGECQGKSPCGTLQDLWLFEPSVNINSDSNTTWTFLPGVHELNSTQGSLILFWQVSNVVLSGSELCERKKEECTIVCTSYLCIFLFIESHNITIQHLSIVYSNSSHLRVSDQSIWETLYATSLFESCTESSSNFRVTSWTFVEVENVCLSSLRLVGYDSQITVYNPRKEFEVVDCHFSQLPPATDEQGVPKSNLALFVSNTPSTAGGARILVSGCTFEADQYFPSTQPSSVNGRFYNHHAIQVKVNSCIAVHCDVLEVIVTIANCTFSRTSGVDVQLSESPFEHIVVRVVKCIVDGHVSHSERNLWMFEHIEGSGVKVQVLTGSVSSLNASYAPGSHSCPDKLLSGSEFSQILISDNIFQRMASIEATGIVLEFVQVDRGNPCSCKVQVIIANNNFTGNAGLRYGSAISASHVWFNGSSVPVTCRLSVYSQPALILKNNFFAVNVAQFSRCLGSNCGSYNQGHFIYFRRWHTAEQCTAGDPSKGVIHLSGFRGSYFAALVNNTITRNIAMGVSVIDSQLVFNGSNFISDNYAPYGGGIFLSAGSQMLLTNGTQLLVKGNMAVFIGGGIFVSPGNLSLKGLFHIPQISLPCFFDILSSDGQVAKDKSLSEVNVNVTLSENIVLVSGSGNSMYANNMQPCVQAGVFQGNYDQNEVFQRVFQLLSRPDEKEIASMPQRICSCNSSGPIDCSLPDSPPLTVFPGQNIVLRLMVLGVADIALSGDLEVLAFPASFHFCNSSNFTNIRQSIPWLRYTQRLSNVCNNVTIPHTSIAKLSSGLFRFILWVPLLDNTPVQAKHLSLETSLFVSILSYCPLGFNISQDSSELLCKCHSALEARHITCFLNNLSFSLPALYWIGASSDNTSLLFSDYCMPGYCRDAYKSTEVLLSKLPQQCLYGRVGTLCGECAEEKSVMLGSSNCMNCPNYGLLLVVVFLVAGPFVIVLICFLNWTVSARSSNGFLLYINIISINSDLLLRSNSFFVVVISWLNFQVGIEMCLFDGMDEFVKTIIGFAFPLYLLSLVAVIVLVSKCINMHRINKLIGPRITPVLATLIILTYTSLSDSVLRSLSYARLYSTDGECPPVWLLDGSLEYFRSTKHLILACIALTVLFVLLIPIMLIALIGDLFRRCISNRWYMNFLDTFHSSYRFRWGFWTGIRLAMRVVLLLLKVTVMPEVVWLITACFSLSLAAAQSVLKPFRHLRFDRFTHRLVDEWCSSEENGRTVANYLDISFLVNLTALFLCISYLPGSTDVFISLSLCVALIELLLILAYHLVEYSPLWPPLLRAITKMVERTRAFLQGLKRSEEQEHGEDDTNHVLLSLPLVLRAEDCQDEDYVSSSEESEDACEEDEETEQSLDTN